MTDSDLESTSYRDPANQLMLTRESMIWFWDHYAPDPEARLHPDAAPLRNADLLRLPPAVVVTAEHDVLRDEGELYVTAAIESSLKEEAYRTGRRRHLPGGEPAAAATSRP